MTKRFETFLGTWKLAALCGALALGVAYGPLTAQAQEMPSFAQVDQNVDGLISEDELLAAYPEATAETFATADINADTVLTPEEYEAMDSMMQ
jgi:hypothetical protein